MEKIGEKSPGLIFTTYLVHQTNLVYNWYFFLKDKKNTFIFDRFYDRFLGMLIFFGYVNPVVPQSALKRDLATGSGLRFYDLYKS